MAIIWKFRSCSDAMYGWRRKSNRHRSIPTMIDDEETKETIESVNENESDCDPITESNPLHRSGE